LAAAGNDFTCYSAGIATWLVAADDDWQRLVSTGLWLRITEEGGGLFGFGYWRPERRSELGLVRTGSDDLGTAIGGVLEELEHSGRVIVAADGLNLPWHTASGSHHAPHWFLLAGDPDALEILDPFACRNEFGEQVPTRRPVSRDELETMVPALPRENPIYRLREVLAFGDETHEGHQHAFQWFTAAADPSWTEPDGLDGPAGIRALAAHFRERGQDPQAYSQADDIWSIARHRAFFCRRLQGLAERDGDDALTGWLADHGQPLAKRWGHIAPLLLQATLALRTGRAASSSVPDTLERLAGQEADAADALQRISTTI
jgi:hypothetical protein